MVKNWLRKNLFVIILLTLGLGTRFLWICYPADVVWDEQHFARFTKGYIERKYFFDIHPPLGKFILLAALKTTHADPGDFDFAISTPYPAGYPYIAARIPAALAGGLFPLIVYLFARALKISAKASFLAAAFVLLDNAIFAESHFALIDIFVPVFGYAALLCFLKHRDAAPYSRRWGAWLALAALAGVLAVSVKWTGGGALLIMAITMFMESIERKDWRMLAGRFAVFAVIGAVVYPAIFLLHFRLLPNSGPGDAFMSERFRASLNGTPESLRADLRPLNFFQRFSELNRRMFAVNAAQNLTHPDSSRFYEWPAGRKRVYFWVDKGDAARRIFLIANPVVWLFGLALFVGGILFLVIRRHQFRELISSVTGWRERIFALEFLSLVYFANWVPFAAITRAMFLYHYFTSLVASLVLGAFLLFELIPAIGFSGGLAQKAGGGRYLFWALLALAAGAFVLFSPLSYGYRPFLRP